MANIIAARESFSAIMIDTTIVLDWPDWEDKPSDYHKGAPVLLDLGLVPDEAPDKDEPTKAFLHEIPTEAIEEYKANGKEAGFIELFGTTLRRLGSKGKKATNSSLEGLIETMLM